MIRAQITLTAAQYVYLIERKRLTGESLSSTIRRAVEILRLQRAWAAAQAETRDASPVVLSA